MAKNPFSVDPWEVAKEFWDSLAGQWLRLRFPDTSSTATRDLLSKIHERLNQVDTEIAVRALGNHLLNELDAAVKTLPSAAGRASPNAAPQPLTATVIAAPSQEGVGRGDAAAAAQSIADMIPKWFEGESVEQMLDEAFAQIRLLEARLAPSSTARSAVLREVRDELKAAADRARESRYYENANGLDCAVRYLDQKMQGQSSATGFIKEKP